MHRDGELINVRNSWGNKIPVWHPVYSPGACTTVGYLPSKHGTEYPDRYERA